MSANDRLLLFAIAMILAGAVGIILWAHEVLELRHLRKKLSKENVVDLLCVDYYLDFYKMLKLYGISPELCDIKHGEHFFTATIGGKKHQIRITLGRVNNHYELVRAERYRDMNWQFTGWYDMYLRKQDKLPARYIVVGCPDAEDAERQKRLPGFYLSKMAIEQLFSECVSR